MTTKASIIRRPAVAGQFYAGDLHKLCEQVDGYLAQAKKSGPDPVALISPHAGHKYSGHVAAWAFKQAEGVDYDAIVVLGTNHRSYASGCSIWPEGAYAMPMGDMVIDSKLAHALMAADGDITFQRNAHLEEHSIEVQLPFLQRVQPGKKFVPIVVCDTSLSCCQALANALQQTLGDRRPLIIASSDLSHFWSYADAVRMDRATLNAIVSLDPSAVDRVAREESRKLGRDEPRSIAPCGIGPVRTTMLYARAMGADQVDILKYANSGDVTDERDQVVGYGAVRFARRATPGG